MACLRAGLLSSFMIFQESRQKMDWIKSLYQGSRENGHFYMPCIGTLNDAVIRAVKNFASQELCPHLIPIWYLHGWSCTQGSCWVSGATKLKAWCWWGVKILCSVYFFMVASVFVLWSPQVYFNIWWIFSLFCFFSEADKAERGKGQIQSWVTWATNTTCDRKV